jgi:hypothetical protein
MSKEEKIHILLLNVFRHPDLVKNWLESPNFLLNRIPQNMIENGEEDILIEWIEDTIQDLRSRI